MTEMGLSSETWELGLSGEHHEAVITVYGVEHDVQDRTAAAIVTYCGLTLSKGAYVIVPEDRTTGHHDHPVCQTCDALWGQHFRLGGDASGKFADPT